MANTMHVAAASIGQGATRLPGIGEAMLGGRNDR
jgi:hypothetical protein